MILKSIQLENFRQFRGIQHFPLDVAPDKVVTLLFGANGAGKTTLLNAFTWCLYGELSHDVEEQDRLVTDFVWQSAAFDTEIPLSVEVAFSHAGSTYRARRAAKVRKQDGARRKSVADLQLWVTDQGQSKVVEGPQQKLDSILPQRLSRFFFFNGERIDKLVNRQAYAEVKQDIKTLLGLEQVERALDHLPKLDRKLGGELKKFGGAQAVEIQEEIEKQETLLTNARAQRESLRDSLGMLTEEHEGVLDLLRKHEAAGPLQAQRDEAVEQVEKARSARDHREKERRNLVATRGYLAFAGSLSQETARLAAGLHERGSLPAPLKREFVDSLIDEARCICGTELGAGTAALRHVEDWRAKAGLAEVEASWQRLSGEVKYVEETRSNLRSRLQALAAELEQDRETIGTWEGRLADLEGRIRDIPMEEVAGLEKKRVDLQARIGVTNQDIGALEKTIEELDVTVAGLRHSLKSAAVGDAVAQKARRRLEVVGAVDAALREILAIRSTEMREKLDTKVKEIFASITVKPFYPKLTDDFELGLYQVHGDGEELPVPKSTGENQILSLSFVAAVSELARGVAQRQEETPETDAGNYPIVMDAAFGSLDIGYQREVARALAKMAPQMVVLVSKSQGEGEVYEQLRPYTNHLGVIVAHTTSAAERSETIDLGGYTYPYIDTESSVDWAELTEVQL